MFAVLGHHRLLRLAATPFAYGVRNSCEHCCHERPRTDGERLHDASRLFPRVRRQIFHPRPTRADAVRCSARIDAMLPNLDGAV